MPPILELLSQLKLLLSEKKEAVFTFLIIALLVSVIILQQDTLSKTDADYLESLNKVRLNQEEEINVLRTQRINAEVYFADQLAACKKECRRTIDSLEDYYYVEFRRLHIQVSKLEEKLNLIK